MSWTGYLVQGERFQEGGRAYFTNCKVLFTSSLYRSHISEQLLKTIVVLTKQANSASTIIIAERLSHYCQGPTQPQLKLGVTK